MTTKRKFKLITIFEHHALVPLSRGLFAKISAEDVDLIDRHNWFVQQAPGRAPYAVTGIYTNRGRDRTVLQMSHVICPPGPGQVVDHINGDSLDNRRENLRACTQSENVQNIRWNPRNTSGVRGVHFAKSRRKFVATIGVRRRLIRLGGFDTLEEAVEARRAAEVRYFTHVKAS